mgnify:CR=1 FL=1
MAKYGTLAETKAKREKFLSALRNTANVRAACQAAGIARVTAYRWRNKWESFAREWDGALDDACDLLEAIAWQRAKSASDRLLMFLLKAHRRDTYGDRVQADVQQQGAITIRVVREDK